MPLSPAARRIARTDGPAALNGILAGALAVAAAEFTAAFVRREATPLVTVGQSVIDRTPQGLKEFAIREFGTKDKLVLQLAIGAALLVFAAVIGVLARHRLWAGLAGIGILGVVTVAAAVSRPADQGPDVIPALIATAVGAAALTYLTRATATPRPATETASTATADPDAPPATPDSPSPTPPPYATPRRRTLLLGAAGAAALLAAVGRQLQNLRFDVSKSRDAVVLPVPAAPAPAPPAGTELAVPGLTPHTTPNADFYRIDTALVVPKIRAEDWKLRIHGMVDREIETDFAALTARPAIERDVTLACVSNPVGGPYIGNARWLGVRLADLLREAGVHPGADQLISRSSDGMTIGTPTAAVLDGRDAMLAFGMNGEPLPLRHGFPVRMIVPGLYGYVSACKWIVEIEATTFTDYDAYWVPRGWSAQAPIKTQSRIDTPKNMAKLPLGRIPIAGVAWAQHRGIAAVEVQIDDEPWQQAELAAQDTTDTWRQFVYHWDARPGPHRIRIRATDQTGATQTEEEVDVAPNGATGYHTIAVTVT
ncbi:molybdopterin-dependent oxidoreductase [Yinghuangia soli]|uniref:Molybdopterin-dependent oxidoreductase n=1 Tax=Yinghuangia soli TaxID=2908204 RepID=A0AA41Q669_9ACTN|nr:molybdopterin-dependent oxidoreductase [Yinghuangia soli]MCF2532323.1 molybdopterin-dependent oxidoreductase [Yinghuangia soli]